jgi:hypothetical protein
MKVWRIGTGTIGTLTVIADSAASAWAVAIAREPALTDEEPQPAITPISDSAVLRVWWRKSPEFLSWGRRVPAARVPRGTGDDYCLEATASEWAEGSRDACVLYMDEEL